MATPAFAVEVITVPVNDVDGRCGSTWTRQGLRSTPTAGQRGLGVVQLSSRKTQRRSGY